MAIGQAALGGSLAAVTVALHAAADLFGLAPMGFEPEIPTLEEFGQPEGTAHLLTHDGRRLGTLWTRSPDLPDDLREITCEALALCAARAEVRTTECELEQIRAVITRRREYQDLVEEVARTCTFLWKPATGEDMWSRNVYNLLGYEFGVDAPSFQKYHDRIHPDDVDRWNRVVPAAGRDERSWSIEYRVVLPSGEVRHLFSTGVPLSDGNHAGAAIDVTDLRRSEDKLRRTQHALAQVSQVTTMGELAASIAHEVNQPLTAMVADAGAANRWLAHVPPNVPRLQASLSSIVRDALRAGEVIRGLNGLAHQAQIQQTPLDVDGLLGEVVELISPDVEREHARLELELGAAGERVLGEAAQLKQVLLNLTSNALEAMRDVDLGSRVLRIRSTVDQGHVRVEVSDTGPGFETDGAERLFEAFYTTKSNGMGLGLTICRTIIERHSGSLIAHNQQPKGGVLSFTVPLMAAVGCG
ncbi:sensor histidine kinase [Sphingomonas xinjiangensis]|uniref:histidine kinase n=1 Tax=Sphingomonas xinjiangensis TaxID=643568 RepID=A0A840YS15_9SPHN|nr:ATP-binding protein [Sphingomonas xinjiangensis]MBB5712469.1 C4-dicarboxylate-specific signal transduction histidine kinase [Sphingomonas xinjiangensis]